MRYSLCYAPFLLCIFVAVSARKNARKRSAIPRKKPSENMHKNVRFFASFYVCF